MAINKISLFEKARNLGSTKTYEEFLAILEAKTNVRAAMPMMMSVDGLDEVDGNPKHYFKLWDKVSTINGITPEQILESRPVVKQPGAELLMVYKNGGLIILQDTDPDQGGNVAMDVQRANEVGQRFIDEWYEQENDEKLTEEITEEMLLSK